MNSDLPVICITTAAGCGHCERMRKPELSDGNEGPRGVYGMFAWSQDLFKSLIFGEKLIGKEPQRGQSPKFRVYEVHFSAPKNDYTIIFEVTEFLWNGAKVVKKITTAEKGFEGIKALIPQAIMNFIPGYPSFLYFDGKSWNASLQSPGERVPLKGYLANGRIIDIKGVCSVDPGYQPAKPEDVIEVARQFLANPSKFEPVIIPSDLSIPPGLKQIKELALYN
jgi:hypothetical protein